MTTFAPRRDGREAGGPASAGPGSVGSGSVGSGPADRDADGRFAVLASERRFTGRIASVRVDTVTMPGGGTAEREVVEHLRAVAIVALDDAGRVVLIEQYRHPLRRRLWEIPAGLMDVHGEEPLAAAQRELHEEAGLAADSWSVLVDVASSPGFCTEAVRVYLATGLTDAPAPEAADEEADLRRLELPLADAVTAVLRGDIVNATAVAGLLAASRVVAGGDDAVRALRPGDDPWTDSPALVAGAGAIGDAPALGSAAQGSASQRPVSRGSASLSPAPRTGSGRER